MSLSLRLLWNGAVDGNLYSKSLKGLSLRVDKWKPRRVHYVAGEKLIVENSKKNSDKISKNYKKN